MTQQPPHRGGRGAAAILTLAALLLSGLFSPLEAQTYRDAKGRLGQAISQKNFKAATEAVDDLIAINSKKSVEALISVGLKGNYYGIEQYIGGKILGMPAGEAYDRVCELASKSKNMKARVLLTLVLGTRQDKDAFRVVLQNLYDKEDAVILSALEKLQEKDHLGAIGHLIEALEFQEKRNRTDGLVAYEIRKTLLQLTREDIVRAVDWQNWWRSRKDNFVRPPANEKSGDRVTSVFKEPSEFFGIEVPAEKVVFLLDISGSMTIKDPAPEEPGDKGKDDKGHGGTGVGGRKKPKKPEKPSQEDIPESRQRLRRVQQELIQTIERLPDNAQFNIVIYNHEIASLSEKLLPANSRNRTKAINYVRSFKAEGETWTDHAMHHVFETPGLRAVFLLSDGAPKRDGQRLPTDPILKWIKEANRFSRVRIHTVGFEQAGSKMRKFMGAIARQNHGKYVELK